MKAIYKPFKNWLLPASLALFALLGLVFLYLTSGSNVYNNSEFGYQLTYPKYAKITFVSSLVMSLDITKADTIAVDLGNHRGLRIQAFKVGLEVPEELCTYKVKGEKFQICVLPSIDNFEQDKELLNIFKSIKF